METPRNQAEMTRFEHIAAEFIHEQRAARRWRIFLRLGWLILAAILLMTLFSSGDISTPVGENHTAMISIKGEIGAESPASADAIVSSLQDAFEDSAAKGIILRINSPGGSPVQAGIINDEILRLKKQYNKPVYAVVEESCTSAAYYIAVAADKIFVDKASIVGSIGVLMDGFGVTDLMKKVGVERRLLTAGAHKGILDPFSAERPEEKAFAQKMLNQIHLQFINVVKEGRGDRLKEDTDTFSGLFWTGQQSVENGLTDGLGNIDFVAREVIKEENIIDYTKEENVAERIAQRFGAAVGAGAVKALQAQVWTAK